MNGVLSAREDGNLTGLHLGNLLLVALLLALGPRAALAQEPVVHVVQANENLFRIALYYGTTVDAIMAANGLDSVYIHVGQRLVIPDASTTAPPPEALTPPGLESDAAPTNVETPPADAYVVQPGESLSHVAARFGTPAWALLRANGLDGPHMVYAGQWLTIPEPVATEPGEEHAGNEDDSADAAADAADDDPPETYTVQRGDTLSGLAARFDTTVPALAHLNGVANPSRLYVGQTLRLSGAAPLPTGGSKWIVVDLSEQRLYAYQGEQLLYTFVASTGAAPYYTRAGEFRVQSKFPNAYGSTWDIWMPYWLGIYWAGSTENGIHALPVTPGGQTLWASALGSPISFGCIVLGTYEASLLYQWAEIGTAVTIQY